MIIQHHYKCLTNIIEFKKNYIGIITNINKTKIFIKILNKNFESDTDDYLNHIVFATKNDNDFTLINKIYPLKIKKDKFLKYKAELILNKSISDDDYVTLIDSHVMCCYI